MTEIKWHREDEIPCEGYYIFSRTDEPDLKRKEVIVIYKGPDGFYLEENKSFNAPLKIQYWDDECRFFGPIPNCYTPLPEEL